MLIVENDSFVRLMAVLAKPSKDEPLLHKPSPGLDPGEVSLRRRRDEYSRKEGDDAGKTLLQSTVFMFPSANSSKRLGDVGRRQRNFHTVDEVVEEVEEELSR